MYRLTRPVPAPQVPAPPLVDGAQSPVIIDQNDDRDRVSLVFQACPALIAETPLPTPSGPCPAGDLRPGDQLVTLDEGPRTLRWIAHLHTRLLGRVAITEIATGVFGATAATHVSPRMPLFFTGWRSELATGTARALIRATDLENGLTIRRRAAGARVILVAPVLDRPALVACNGLILRLSGLCATELPAELLPDPDPGAARLGPPENLIFATPRRAQLLTDPHPVFW